MNGLPSVTTLPGTYPGARGVRPFAGADDETFWVLDFHAPQGLTPLGLSVVEIVTRASRQAADAVPMPGTRGLVERVAGSHVYVSLLRVDPEDAADRAVHAAERLPALLSEPHRAWERVAAELADERATLRAAEVGDAPRYLADAFAAVERAWRVHFDFMYPLLAGYFAFLDEARALGIPAADVPPLLQGFPTQITETDRAIWGLAEAAHELGVSDSLATAEPSELEPWLRGAGRFRDHVDAFLDRFGWRTEGIYEVALVPWIDDPTPVLARVKVLLDEVRERSFADMERASITARRDAEEAIFERLGAPERERFERALADVRAANFAWWNEEHNAAIDLCVHIPVRRAALAVGAAAELDAPDDAFFLFRGELEELAAGDASVAAQVPGRRELHAQWAARRSEFPQLVGRPPGSVEDPVLREIFGVGDEVVDATGGDLHGIPASAGVARGRARVIRAPAELEQLRPREVIVCEATTPSWTPAFAAAAACVCDQGGSLTHAAIVSREYGVPCVTGTVRATELIATGDLVEVDGGAGRVRVLERAQAASGTSG
jgi:pyruvate,water dikinase